MDTQDELIDKLENLIDEQNYRINNLNELIKSLETTIILHEERRVIADDYIALQTRQLKFLGS